MSSEFDPGFYEALEGVKSPAGVETQSGVRTLHAVQNGQLFSNLPKSPGCLNARNHQRDREREDAEAQWATDGGNNLD